MKHIMWWMLWRIRSTSYDTCTSSAREKCRAEYMYSPDPLIIISDMLS